MSRCVANHVSLITVGYVVPSECALVDDLRGYDIVCDVFEYLREENYGDSCVLQLHHHHCSYHIQALHVREELVHRVVEDGGKEEECH